LAAIDHILEPYARQRIDSRVVGDYQKPIANQIAKLGLSGNTMRYPTILLCTLMLLAVSACRTGQHTRPQAPVLEANTVDVPLPASTPFDNIGNGRAEYLESYREGYLNGVQGAMNPYARVGFVVGPQDRGWRDGAFAARISRAMRMTKD
jgi:hypothetical protein